MMLFLFIYSSKARLSILKVFFSSDKVKKKITVSQMVLLDNTKIVNIFSICVIIKRTLVLRQSGISLPLVMVKGPQMVLVAQSRERLPRKV